MARRGPAVHGDRDLRCARHRDPERDPVVERDGARLLLGPGRGRMAAVTGLAGHGDQLLLLGGRGAVPDADDVGGELLADEDGDRDRQVLERGAAQNLVAERGQRRLAPGLDAIAGDVAHEGDDHRLRRLDARDRDLDRESLAVGAHALALGAGPGGGRRGDDLAQPRALELVLVRRDDQLDDVGAERSLARAAEGDLRRGVPLDHATGWVEGDHAVDRGIDQGALQGVALRSEREAVRARRAVRPRRPRGARTVRSPASQPGGLSHRVRPPGRLPSGRSVYVSARGPATVSRGG